MLYLIRHAHAVTAAEDPARPLSRSGRKQVKVLGRYLRRLGIEQPEAIWHSSLVRSAETAERLKRHWDLAVPLTLMVGLEPDDDLWRVVRRLRDLDQTVALVGHEPHLSALASRLLAGRAAPVCFIFEKSAVLALEGGPTRWRVRWHLSPEVIA